MAYTNGAQYLVEFSKDDKVEFFMVDGRILNTLFSGAQILSAEMKYTEPFSVERETRSLVVDDYYHVCFTLRGEDEKGETILNGHAISVLSKMARIHSVDFIATQRDFFEMF